MTTSQLSIPGLGNSTSLPPDSRAKTFHVPTPTGEGWMVGDRGCSLKPCESYAWFNQPFPSLKTYQTLLTEDCLTYSTPLTAPGLMRNGKLYRRQAWVRLTKGNDSFSLPTPKASDRLGIVSTKPGQTKHLSAEILGGDKTRRLNLPFIEWMQGYPTNWTELEL